MNKKEEYHRIKIVLEFLGRVRTKYNIVFWGISGSTARGDFSPKADIDLAIQLDLPVRKSSEEASRVWHEFEKWVTPILEEFKNKYGIEIDLSW